MAQELPEELTVDVDATLLAQRKNLVWVGLRDRSLEKRIAVELNRNLLTAPEGVLKVVVMGLQLSFFTLGFLGNFALVLGPHVMFDFLRDG